MSVDKVIMNRRPTSKEELIELIKKHDEWVIGGLLVLYAKQTMSEQYDFETKYSNGVGFNNADASFMSRMAVWYGNKGFFSNKQITAIRKTLIKYGNQMFDYNVIPKPNNKINAIRNLKKEPLADIVNGKIKITFDFDQELVSLVKTLSNRNFNKDDITDKHWTAILTVPNIEILKDKFKFSEQLQKWYDQTTLQETVTPIDVPGMNDMFPFQKYGVGYIESRNGRALVADEMGLGKTIQALGYLAIHPELRPAIIVVPASLKLNWKREIEKWMDKSISVTILQSRTPYKFDLTDIIIINYDILDAWTLTLKKLKCKVMIIDEVHFIKSRKAQRTKATRKLAKGIKHVIGLSGTPITNKPIEFFESLNLIRPDIFPTFWPFATKYCAPVNNGYGWSFGSSNKKELHSELTKTLMLRRLKKDVLTELPPKIRTVIPLEIDNRNEYDQAEEEMMDNTDNEPGYYLAQFEKLKQITVKGKMKFVYEWIDNFLNTNQKLIIFCTHRNIVEQVTEYYKGILVKLYGGMSAEQKQESVDSFQNNDKIKLFAGNIKAAGIGITLTAASATCFIELGWTPSEHIQAEDRIHRIGQEADSVFAYYLVAEETIEEDIAKLIDDKHKVLDAILDGKETEDTNLLSELLIKVSKRRNK